MSVSIERIKTETQSSSSSSQGKVDQESYRGRFGWCEIQKKHIPYLYRGAEKEKYVSVRIIEEKLLDLLLTCLPTDLTSFYDIKSHYITAAEARLLNDINVNHCGSYFGKTIFNEKDVVVKLEEAKEFFHFISLCYNRTIKKECNETDRCGFVIIGGDGIIPFVVYKSKRYVPLFYLEDEDITEELEGESRWLNEWDLVYMKFCCKIQGINESLYESDDCKVVPLDKIIPQETEYEDYWPETHEYDSPGFIRKLTPGGWTIKPTGKPFVNSSNQKLLLSPEEFEEGIQVLPRVLPKYNSPLQGRTPTFVPPQMMQNQRRTQQQRKPTNYREQTTSLIEASKQITNSFIQRNKNRSLDFNSLRNQITIASGNVGNSNAGSRKGYNVNITRV